MAPLMDVYGLSVFNTGIYLVFLETECMSNELPTTLNKLYCAFMFPAIVLFLVSPLFKLWFPNSEILGIIGFDYGLTAVVGLRFETLTRLLLCV